MGWFPIVAKGEVGERLSKLLPQSKVKVTAKLTMLNWQTKEGKGRQRMELEATAIEVLSATKKEIA